MIFQPWRELILSLTEFGIDEVDEEEAELSNDEDSILTQTNNEDPDSRDVSKLIYDWHDPDARHGKNGRE